ncbi:hypothetical protein RHGRI_031770 [Rhododendron griersonianum]|uniref:Exostosin GT47 domain-containing protein n=1 Tax=Rhododendron griersonianum TaxID=479676 RepID=A0AAV6I9V0_9ERIC|nr:hypothetical protein RHGRI_031770 [Rhododendron griersonianum]
MGSPSSRPSRLMGPHHHAPCTRTHQIGALTLVAATFFLTRLFDHPSSSCNPYSLSTVVDGGPASWPERGYGSHLSLKIYVYDELEIDGLRTLMYGRDGKISPDECVKGQWGTQVKIHRMLLKSRFRTTKKGEADLFFVPSYVKCVRTMGGLSDKEINQTYVKVLSQMPYFRLSGGRNHIFVFPSGAGATLFRSWATYLNRSIILTPELTTMPYGTAAYLTALVELPPDTAASRSLAGYRLTHAACPGAPASACFRFPLSMLLLGDRTDKRETTSFNTWKDIIIPGNVHDGMTTHGDRLVQPLPLSKRKYLANFLGRAQGKIGRLQLVELAKKYPDKLESPELKFSGPEKLGRIDYFEHLRNAKFCLAPRGESSWTLRFYESFFVECVPVIISDYAELPFQNVIDYTQLSIKWPWNRIGSELLEYLESVPEKDIERMITHGRQVRCLWVYAPESEPCSAFNGIMWELQRKVRQFHQSAETFWLHNGSIVNRNLVEFSHWKPPMPLP